MRHLLWMGFNCLKATQPLRGYATTTRRQIKKYLNCQDYLSDKSLLCVFTISGQYLHQEILLFFFNFPLLYSTTFWSPCQSFSQAMKYWHKNYNCAYPLRADRWEGFAEKLLFERLKQCQWCLSHIFISWIMCFDKCY